MIGPGGMSDALRGRIFDAVLEELGASGIDGFRVEGVARRAAVDPDTILAEWRDRRVLLMDALVARADQSNPCPDTGSLSEDLREFSAELAQATESRLGRRLLHRMLPWGGDTDMSEVGPDLLAVRFESLKPMLDHAAERGELRPGVDPNEAIRMICTAYLRDVIFRDTAVRPEYADQVHDIVLYGLLAGPLREAALSEDFARRERERTVLRATLDGLVDPVAMLEAVRDDDGQITDFTFAEVNPAAVASLRHSRRELLGVAIAMTPLAGSPEILAACIRCIETGDPVIVEAIGTDGSQAWCELRAAPAGRDRLTMTWRDTGGLNDGGG